MSLKGVNNVLKFMSIYLSKLHINNLFVVLRLKKMMDVRKHAKTFCIYTFRYRSVHSSFKMSRHKLKNFLDNRTYSNMYIK